MFRSPVLPCLQTASGPFPYESLGVVRDPIARFVLFDARPDIVLRPPLFAVRASRPMGLDQIPEI